MNYKKYRCCLESDPGPATTLFEATAAWAAAEAFVRTLDPDEHDLDAGVIVRVAAWPKITRYEVTMESVIDCEACRGCGCVPGELTAELYEPDPTPHDHDEQFSGTYGGKQ